jgi:tetratricopeptide (TPR) repeat protein
VLLISSSVFAQTEDVDCESLVPDAETVEDYLGIGKDYFNDGDYEQAIIYHTCAIEFDSDSVVTYIDRALSFYELEEYELALEDLKYAIELDPDYSPSYSERANIYFLIQEYELAIADYNRYLELRPNNPITYTNRGLNYESLGEYELALADYDKAIELDPTLVRAYIFRGSFYLRTSEQDTDWHYEIWGDEEKAIADYTYVIEHLDPKNVIAYTSRGAAYLKIGFRSDSTFLEKSISDLLQAIELDPEFVDAYKNLWVAYLELRQSDNAILVLERLLELTPENLELYIILGQLHDHPDSMEKAMGYYFEYLELAGDEANPEWVRWISQRNAVYEAYEQDNDD